MRALTIVVCAVAITGIRGVGNAEESLATLVEANRQAVDLLRAYDATIRNFDYVDRAKESEVLMSTWRSTKEGERERTRFELLTIPPRDDGRPLNLGDAMRDGTVSKVLLNWDAESPQKLSPLDVGTVKAFVEPQSRVAPANVDPGMVLGFTYRVDILDESRTLAELVDESQRAELVGLEEIDGRKLWHIRAAHPDPRYAEISFDIFLDPTVNFHARRIVTRGPIGGSRGGNGDAVREITKFHDYGDGVFFPEEIATYGLNNTVARSFVSEPTINASLPADAFDFRFPENCLVTHLPPVAGKAKVELWGPDNRPALEVTGRESLEQYARSTSSPPVASRWRQWALLGNIGIVVAVVAYVIWRRAWGGVR